MIIEKIKIWWRRRKNIETGDDILQQIIDSLNFWDAVEQTHRANLKRKRGKK